jgi:hypothetical protein
LCELKPRLQIDRRSAVLDVLIMGDCALNREDVPCESNEHVFRPEVYEAAAGDTWIEEECCTSCGWSWREIADHDRGDCCCPASHATPTAVCERER